MLATPLEVHLPLQPLQMLLTQILLLELLLEVHLPLLPLRMLHLQLQMEVHLLYLPQMLLLLLLLVVLAAIVLVAIVLVLLLLPKFLNLRVWETRISTFLHQQTGMGY